MTDNNRIPNAIEFYLNKSLYEVIRWNDEKDVLKILQILFFDGTFDSYCPSCGKEATFQAIFKKLPEEFKTYQIKKQLSPALLGVPSHTKPNDIPKLKSGIYEVKALCTRNNNHFQWFSFLVENNFKKNDEDKVICISSIKKIGQYPSFADLNIPKVKKYTKILGKELSSELTRAIGLAAHDVGVGAYVYLRRIFENLIEQAHQEAVKTNTEFDENIYKTSKMGERIELLKNYLPDFLVENSKMYSILSKGIHQLTEQECLKYFDTLKIGIELILDEKLEQYEKIKKIEKAKKSIDITLSKVAG